MNPKVEGQIQTHWRWLIAAYLFLGGVGAGAYTIAAINTFLSEVLEPSTVVGLWISWPALIVGSLCLLADLGQPTKAVLAGMKPGTSWIARGFWIISIFMIVAMVHTWLSIPRPWHSSKNAKVESAFGSTRSSGSITKR